MLREHDTDGIPVRRIVIGMLMAQTLGFTISASVALVGALAGAALSPLPYLATAPSGATALGAAIMAVPAGRLLSVMRRGAAFCLGASVGAAGALLCCAATYFGLFWLLIVGSVAVGCSTSFIAYYRFAGASILDSTRQPRFHSAMIATGLVAAIASGVLIKVIGGLPFPLFPTAYGCIAGLALVAAGVTLWSARSIGPASSQAQMAHPGPRIDPAVWRPIVAGSAVTAYMSVLMIAAPIAMVSEHMTLGDVATAMQLHFVGMYAPALFVAAWVARGAGLRVVIGGITVGLFGVFITLAGDSALHYAISLAACGVCWSFVLLVASSEISRLGSHRGQTFFAAGTLWTGAAASLVAGAVVKSFGWPAVNYLALILLAVIAATCRPQGWSLSRDAGATR